MTTLDAPRPQAGSGAAKRPTAASGTLGSRRRAGRIAWLTALFVALIGVMIRIGPTSMTTTFPNLGDPVLYAWALSWNAHAVVTAPLHLFDANIFWPHPLSLAYSDNMFVVMPPFALVRALGGSWALGINTVMLGLLLLSLAATYSLARWLTARTDAAILAAIAFTFSSYTLSHLGHTQLLLLGQFPLGFLLAFKWLEQRRTRDAVLLGALNVSVALGALYYLAIWVVCLAVVLIGWLVLVRFHPEPGFWNGLLVVGAISLLSVPFLTPYAELGQERPLVPEWGLNVGDVVTVAPGSLLYTGLDDRAQRSGDRFEHAFFPGFITLALAATGIAAIGWGLTRRGRRDANGDANGDDVEDTGADEDGVVASRRRFLWLLLLAGAVSAVLAIGPEMSGITMPFKVFHAAVPGFSGIRVASRLAVPALLAGAVLAAIGFTAIVRRLSPRVATVAAVIVGAVLLLELAAPMFRTELPTDDATLAVYRALDRKPSGAVAELPIQNPARDGGAAWAYVEAPRMTYSSLDWHDRVNGYSGGFPSDYLVNADALNEFPSPGALATAARLKVRYFVLHTGTAGGFPQWTDARVRSALRNLPRGATATHHGSSWLVDLGPDRG